MTRRRGDGQAAVELALVLPLVVVCLLLVVQVALVMRDQVLVTHAAREAAREAAVDASAERVRSATIEGSGLTSGSLQLELEQAPAARVEARVTYRSATEVPLVGPLIPDVELHGAATMRLER